MTEHETWLYLAKLWTEPELDTNKQCYVLSYCYTIVRSVEQLCAKRQIAARLAAKMTKKLRAALWDRDGAVMLIYGVDRASARARAAYCRRAAKAAKGARTCSAK